MALSKIIFSGGKEKAMKSLFDTSYSNTSFSYVALGWSENNGFDDPDITGDSDNGFEEITDETYYRIGLEFYKTDKDTDTGKVTVYFKAELDYDNIQNTQYINQLAVVDTGMANAANTNFYSATTFPTFTKNQSNAMTFVIGFRF